MTTRKKQKNKKVSLRGPETEEKQKKKRNPLFFLWCCR